MSSLRAPATATEEVCCTWTSGRRKPAQLRARSPRVWWCWRAGSCGALRTDHLGGLTVEEHRAPGDKHGTNRVIVAVDHPRQPAVLLGVAVQRAVQVRRVNDHQVGAVAVQQSPPVSLCALEQPGSVKLVARGARPPAGRLPAGLRLLSQVSALKRSPHALRVPYRGRIGKRDALPPGWAATGRQPLWPNSRPAMWWIAVRFNGLPTTPNCGAF